MLTAPHKNQQPSLNRWGTEEERLWNLANTTARKWLIQDLNQSSLAHCPHSTVPSDIHYLWVQIQAQVAWCRESKDVMYKHSLSLARS